jgi:hypothetical protein
MSQRQLDAYRLARDALRRVRMAEAKPGSHGRSTSCLLHNPVAAIRQPDLTH